jgi:hypothetical protein
MQGIENPISFRILQDVDPDPDQGSPNWSPSLEMKIVIKF